MNVEYDVDKHSIEEITGKSIVINGVTYTFQDAIAEGGECIVIPLQNNKSGISKFVCKLYKYRRDHEEYKRILSSIKGYSTLEINLISGDEIALHTEVYEINGALFRFQRFLGSILEENSSYQTQLMDIANGFFKKAQYEDALKIYKEVLAKNPFHTDALINISACYAELEMFGEAIAAINKSISVDCNINENHIQLSKIYLNFSYPEFALAVLEKALDRWKYNTIILEEILRISLEYDFFDIAQFYIDFIIKELEVSKEKLFIHRYDLQNKLLASEKRVEAYQELIKDACSLQENEEFDKASSILEQAIKKSMNNLIALFNYKLCSYYLNQNTDDMSSYFALIYYRANTLMLKNYCLLFGFLTSLKETKYDVSMQMVKKLSQIESIWDLPMLPKLYYYSYGLEFKKVSLIIEKLVFLRGQYSQNESLELLIKNYTDLNSSLISQDV